MARGIPPNRKAAVVDAILDFEDRYLLWLWRDDDAARTLRKPRADA
jgi:hypothetical protein